MTWWQVNTGKLAHGKLYNMLLVQVIGSTYVCQITLTMFQKQEAAIDCNHFHFEGFVVMPALLRKNMRDSVSR